MQSEITQDYRCELCAKYCSCIVKLNSKVINSSRVTDIEQITSVKIDCQGTKLSCCKEANQILRFCREKLTYTCTHVHTFTVATAAGACTSDKMRNITVTFFIFNIYMKAWPNIMCKKAFLTLSILHYLLTEKRHRATEGSLVKRHIPPSQISQTHPTHVLIITGWPSMWADHSGAPTPLQHLKASLAESMCWSAGSCPVDTLSLCPLLQFVTFQCNMHGVPMKPRISCLRDSYPIALMSVIGLLVKTHNPGNLHSLKLA